MLFPSRLMKPMALSRSNKSPIVLVADRQSEAAGRLARRLTRHGLKASHTGSGEEVLALARAGRLGLAIVDAELTDMPGHALAARLRQLDPRIPVLMTAGDDRPELEIQARRLGVLYYTHKPADARLLEKVVAKALGHSHRAAVARRREARPAAGRRREVR